METKYFSENSQCWDDDVRSAAEIIRRGGVVAFPTETVYGLGANALDTEAVLKIFKIKGRPQDNPLIIHISAAEQLELYCRDIPDAAYALAERFWPGPLTMVLYRKDIIPASVSAGLDTVAVRCPNSSAALRLISESGVPIAAPSANLSGKPSTTRFEHIVHDLDGKADALIDGGDCSVGVESTIIDLCSTPPRLLRPGGITPEQLEEVLGSVEIDRAVYKSLSPGEVARAPGMKYRHYAPDASVVLVRGSTERSAEYINARLDDDTAVLCFDEERPLYAAKQILTYGSGDDSAALAKNLFAALRDADKLGVKKVFARCPGGVGVGLAVENRLQKAAGYNIVDLREKLVIGITGPTGAGKTMALSVLSELGALVIDCDAVYHDLLENSREMVSELEENFPGCSEGGRVDTKKLGRMVYNDAEANALLQKITHRYVIEETEKLIAETDKRLVAIDAFALIESGLNSRCNAVVAVTAPKEIRARRIMTREGIDYEYAMMRINAQKPDEWYKERSDYVLENNFETIDMYKDACIGLFEKIIHNSEEN